MNCTPMINLYCYRISSRTGTPDDYIISVRRARSGVPFRFRTPFAFCAGWDELDPSCDVAFSIDIPRPPEPTGSAISVDDPEDTDS